ncbi:MAG: hypothetical protein U5K70_06885 [Halodesulfurarchaeum sp.]|nr:hypothetical protein [Halodesulfurarchaeum sp.]
MGTHRWLPPIPPEHGAKTLLLVALATPVSIGIGAETAVPLGFGPAYLLFVGIAAGSMLFREATRQFFLSDPTKRRRYGLIAALEAVGILGLTGGLMALEGTGWGLLLLLPIGGAIEARLARDRRSKPLLKAGTGVLAIGALVPIGLLLLGFTDPTLVLAGYGLFFGYHLLAVLRVGAAVEAGERVPAIALLVPLTVVGIAVVGYGSGFLGISSPVVFGLSALRSGQLQQRTGTPSLKRLGQTEAMLSLAFVLAGPFLLA